MGIKLLLADDSITIQKVVGIIFASEDYDLAIVDNGNAALTRARDINPDVLLVDAVMPGKTGYEVCEEIRRDPALHDVPILLLTGAFEPFDEEKAKKCGADDFISKPFESQNLIDKVTSLAELGMRRSAAAVPVAVPSSAQAFAQPAQVPSPAAAAAPPRPSPSGPVTIPPVTPPVAESAAVSQSPADSSQFTVEIVDSDQDDDLWGAFDLEDVAEGDVSAAATAETFITEITEEPFSFAEEPESVVPPAATASQWGAVDDNAFVFEEEPEPAPPAATPPKWEPVEEETFDFGEESQGFEVVPDEQVAGFEIEPAAVALEPSALHEFDVFMEEPGPAAPAAKAEEIFDIFEEAAAFSAAGQTDSGKVSPASAAVQAPASQTNVPPPAADPGFDLQFASEDDYTPVTQAASFAAPPIASAAASVAAAATVAAPAPASASAAPAPVPAPATPFGSELTLSEEQLTALVSRISRDILEKIAWEVVPDLAESIIREEIRKIKEG